MSINLTDEIEVKTKKGKLGAAKQIFLEGDTISLQKAHEDNQAHLDTLDTRSTQIEESLKNIAATGGASDANAVIYDNKTSGLTAINVKGALDELTLKDRSQDTEISKKANSTDVTSQIQTEQNRVNGELAKKFDSVNITQELGTAEDKVISQKAVSAKFSNLKSDLQSSIDKKANAEQVNNSLYDLEQKIGDRVVVEGNVTNLPDEEDLTFVKESERNILKFSDKRYAPENFSGKGYKYLRKNIQNINLAVTRITVSSIPTKDGEISVIINNINTHISLVKNTHNTPALVAQTISDTLVSAHTDYDIEVAENIVTLTRKHSGEVASSSFNATDTGVTLAIEDSTKSVKRNILTKDMINKSDTIYEIRYDFDLDGATINLQERCILNFNGGRIFNGELKGRVENSYLYPDYFYNNSGDYSYAIQQCFNICGTLRLKKLYPVKRKITTTVYTRIISDSIKVYGFESYIDNDFMLYINAKENGEGISTPWSNCEILGVKFVFHNNGGGYNPNPYFNGGKAILKASYLVLNQCTFYYFDTSLQCNIYSDNTAVKNCDFFYGVNLKPGYDSSKDFDIIFKHNGDNILLKNIQCANINFREVSNATIINAIQCGIRMYYSHCYCLGYHNEQPVKYPITLQASTLKLENGVIAKDNSIPISVVGFGLVRLHLTNFSYYNMVLTKKDYFSNADFIKIDNTNDCALTLYVNNLNNAMNSNNETQVISINRKNASIFTPNAYNYIYDSGSNSFTLYDKHYKCSVYLYDSFKSIKDKYNFSTLSNGVYTYKVYEILDNKRKLLRYIGKGTVNTEEGYINTVSIFGDIVRKEVLICREFNDSIKCALYRIYSISGIMEDYGDVYTNNNLQWQDNVLNDYSIVKSVDYKGDNIIINSEAKVKVNDSFLNNDKLIVGDVTYTYNGTEFITNIGTTENRPMSPHVGFIYKDTTLNKLILWEGSKWVNLDGSELS